MSIIYTSKAKEDLINIDWRIRQKIVNTLGKLEERKTTSPLSRMHDSEYYKLKLQNYLIIGKIESQNFNIITVIEQKKIKFPD
jgi:mRNA-degrading endonuclease RelE of RelBE toxin-antitoxin system